jgi:hypothetical protein
VVLFFFVRSVVLVRTAIALGAALALAACATVDSPRRSSDSPTVRCVNEPGRGGSLDATRPLFFLFCAQSP